MSNIHARCEEGVGFIELDNPEGGFLTGGMVAELDRITGEWAMDESVRAIVLTGSNPGTFITHYSPFELQNISSVVKGYKKVSQVLRLRRITRLAARCMHWLQRLPSCYRLFAGISRGGSLHALLEINRFHQMLQRWQTMDKVIIAAINGHCMGGGFEIALACDFRLMARGDFALGLPEAISAITPGAGGTQWLARLVGANRAVELILTGRLCNADEAERLGLISSAVDAAELPATAMELARRMAAMAPLSVGGVKRSIHHGLDQPLQRGLELEMLNFLDSCISHDAAAAGDYYLSQYETGRHPVEIFDTLRQGRTVRYQGH